MKERSVSPMGMLVLTMEKQLGPDLFLLDESSLDFDLLEKQSLSNLQWYDFCFRKVLPERVVRSFDGLGFVIYSVQKQETIILVSVYRASEMVIKNLLCHFERLNIRNYIFVGPSSDFQLDLARNGHPVIDAGKFFDRYVNWTLHITSNHGQKAPLPFIKSVEALTAFKNNHCCTIEDIYCCL